MQAGHMEYQVTLGETPFGITFFEGLDIPLVEGVSSKGAAAAAVKQGARVVRAGDRLVGINGRDVAAFSTPHVLALLAEASWRLRRSLSTGDTSEGGVVLRFRAAVAEGGDPGSGSSSSAATPAGAAPGAASSTVAAASSTKGGRSPSLGLGRPGAASGGAGHPLAPTSKSGVSSSAPPSRGHSSRSPTPTSTLTLAQLQLEDVHRVNELLEVGVLCGGSSSGGGGGGVRVCCLCPRSRNTHTRVPGRWWVVE
jgi:hypothetical protein